MSWEDIIKRDDGKPRNTHERYVAYMAMRTPQEALDIIAELIADQAPLKEQDAWLKAARELGYVEGELE